MSINSDKINAALEDAGYEGAKVKYSVTKGWTFIHNGQTIALGRSVKDALSAASKLPDPAAPLIEKSTPDEPLPSAYEDDQPQAKPEPPPAVTVVMEEPEVDEFGNPVNWAPPPRT